jgi:hypothetical protein
MSARTNAGRPWGGPRSHFAAAVVETAGRCVGAHQFRLSHPEGTIEAAATPTLLLGEPTWGQEPP